MVEVGDDDEDDGHLTIDDPDIACFETREAEEEEEMAVEEAVEEADEYKESSEDDDLF